MMASEQQNRLIKLREERIAREKARIEKLREMNLKKYNKSEPQATLKHSVSNVSVANKSVKNYSSNLASRTSVSNAVKNNLHMNGAAKRPISAPNLNKKPIDNKTTNASKNNIKPTQVNDKVSTIKNEKNNMPVASKSTTAKAVGSNKSIVQPKEYEHTKKATVDPKLSRKSIAATTVKQNGIPKPADTRKSMQPPKQIQNQNPNRQSVFERLYKPKVVHKESISNAMKLQTDPNFLKKTLKDSRIILNKRHTLFDTKPSTSQPVRRSISAVHFKRISRSELGNCVHKWASIGEKLDKVHLNDINEDDCVKGEVVVSAVKSERKRVKFHTPVPFNFNTPKPEELQNRLKNWLQKRGKSLDSFHHLQCFGIHHMSKDIKPLPVEPPKFELYDDENKENEPLESDSDDGSYTENMNEEKDLLTDQVDFNKDKWRRASYVSDSATDINESRDMTITSSEAMHHVDELLLGALNDLTELLREGFDWEQCARWLRAIRDRFPAAPDSAAYWECRAALEERRGDLPASVQCWEEAIAKGTEHSVVDANLDQLLGKFMQLHISPSSGRRREADPKMVDVKNVFKSTIIRFAVQQAKLRQSNQSEHTSQPVYTVTPVRRSARLSTHWRGQTPLRICSTVKQASELGPTVFKPNHTLVGTP